MWVCVDHVLVGVGMYVSRSVAGGVRYFCWPCVPSYYRGQLERVDHCAGVVCCVCGSS